MYKLLSSWNFTLSALVPEKAGPPASKILASRAAKVVPFLVAHSSMPLVNWAKLIFLADLSLTLAKTRSISVAVSFLSRILQSFANLANVFPSISAAPAEKLLKTSWRLPAAS